MYSIESREVALCLSIYLLILQHHIAGIMCRCLVCFRPGVSAVKVKIEQLDKTGESEIKMIDKNVKKSDEDKAQR